MAVFTSAAPVRTMTAASPSAARIRWSSSMPDITGILRSVTTSSGRSSVKAVTPARPSSARRQAYPADRKI